MDMIFRDERDEAFIFGNESVEMDGILFRYCDLGENGVDLEEAMDDFRQSFVEVRVMVVGSIMTHRLVVPSTFFPVERAEQTTAILLFSSEALTNIIST